MSNLYSKEIIDNYKNPKNFKKPQKFTHSAHAANSVCGDELDLYLNVENGKITDIGFQGSGCAICVGAMSLLSEDIKKGKDVAKLATIKAEKHVLEKVGMDSDSPRIKCATLTSEVIEKILEQINTK